MFDQTPEIITFDNALTDADLEGVCGGQLNLAAEAFKVVLGVVIEKTVETAVEVAPKVWDWVKSNAEYVDAVY